MRTTVRIDEALYRRVKAEAGRTGRTVSQLLEDALREALRPRQAPQDLPPLVTYGGRGVLPGVDLTDSAHVREVMDEGAPADAMR